MLEVLIMVAFLSLLAGLIAFEVWASRRKGS